MSPKDYDANKYIRTYRQRHTEKVRRWQLNAYANALRKAGWTCIPPGSQP